MSQDHHAEDGGQPRPRRRRDIHRRRHPLLRGSTIVLAVLPVLLLALGGVAYVKLNGNINRVDITRMLGQRPSTAAGPDQPMNILLLGSDTRTGAGNDAYGSEATEYGSQNARSDTSLLVHLSGDRTSITVVSIPRDSMVMSPKSCDDPDSTVENGVLRQWNQNFSRGGPGCVVKTIEGLTDIYVDHFMVVDFAGFATMVDALGGVEICTPVAIRDADSKADIPAGRHRLDGKQALSYVRVRHALGDGSDLGRIKRQQAFLSSVAQEATKTSLLLRPDKLYRFLDAATKSTTTDGMNIATMTEIANSVRNLGVDKITFVTVPTEQYPPDPNRVQWTKAADQLWENLRVDRPVGAGKTVSTSSPTTRPLTVKPDAIQVSLVNSSGYQGLAGQVGNALRPQGFEVGLVTTAQATTSGTLVRYAPGMAEAARTVQAAFPGSTTREDSELTAGVAVMLGTGSPRVVAVANRLGTEPLPSQPISPTPTGSASVQSRAASDDICAAS